MYYGTDHFHTLQQLQTSFDVHINWRDFSFACFFLKIYIYQLERERTSTKGCQRGRERAVLEVLHTYNSWKCFWLLYQYLALNLKVTSPAMGESAYIKWK